MPTLRLHSWSSVSHTVRDPQALCNPFATCIAKRSWCPPFCTKVAGIGNADAIWESRRSSPPTQTTTLSTFNAPLALCPSSPSLAGPSLCPSLPSSPRPFLLLPAPSPPRHYSNAEALFLPAGAPRMRCSLQPKFHRNHRKTPLTCPEY